MVWLYFQLHTNLFAPYRKRMLHVAPEPVFAQKLSANPYLEYVTVDIGESAYGISTQSDIAKTPFPPATFDIIYASHVLEHVQDDIEAMCELKRILKPSGWAVLQVPIDYSRATTFEDASIVEPAERTRVFGQHNHLRLYGRDYPERLKKAGFKVKADDFVKTLSASAIDRFGFLESEVIYFCMKQ